MRWLTNTDKKLNYGWKTAICPKCGSRRPIKKLIITRVKKRTGQFTIPIDVIDGCDKCVE
jgi:hypothetical protein